MDIVSYLSNIYGYDTPIFIKDVRIGRKSKTAIREEFYRATKRGDLERKSSGIYYLKSNKDFGSGITFRKIVENKFMYPDCVSLETRELFIDGYYSGMTFLNMIGLSEQVPAIPEVTTNKTSSKKRYFVSGNSMAIIRKGRIPIDFTNWKDLQFFDMFYFLSLDEVKEKKDIIIDYAKKNGITDGSFSKYINYYGPKTIKKIMALNIFPEISKR